MCIAVFIWKVHPFYPFLLLLNRDEYHNRPTIPLGWWQDDPHILGGRDAVAGGTWLCCSKDGRLAFLTNVRELVHPSSPDQQPKSRGYLPLRFLQSKKSPEEFADELVEEATLYNGFNLIVADLCSMSMLYITNRPKGSGIIATQVSPGIHVLSNAKLDSPWPKVVCMISDRCLLLLHHFLLPKVKEIHLYQIDNFSGANSSPPQANSTKAKRQWNKEISSAQRLEQSFKDLMDKYGEGEIPLKDMSEKLMNDTTKDDESKLPQIYPPEREYHLSSIFVDADMPTGRYGTRSTSALAMSTSGNITYFEKHLDADQWKEQIISFQIRRETMT